MDIVFLLHLLFIIFFLSIPFWKIKYLRYGVYAPITLATIWIIFNGCPLTQIQRDLNDEYFSRVLLKIFYPDISDETTVRISYYILLIVTLIGFIRLCPIRIRHT
jgi:hypothetical protein